MGPRTWIALFALLQLFVCALAARRALVNGPLQDFIDAEARLLSASGCEPLEVHLALGDHDGELRVQWRTKSTGCPSVVTWGRSDLAQQQQLRQQQLQEEEEGDSRRRLQADVPLLRAEGSSYVISEDLMCDSPAKKKPFTVVMHTAVMTDLLPDAAYWYQLGDSDRTWDFTAPKARGSDRRFSFIAFGDMGESGVKSKKAPMAAKTVAAIGQELFRRPADLILHIGDLAYADGKYKVWDSFMAAVEPLAARTPYMVGIGNHEAGPCRDSNGVDPSGEPPYQPDWGNYGPESGGECGSMTAHRFIMPGLDLAARPGAFSGTLRTAAQARALRRAAQEDDDSAASASAGTRTRTSTSGGRGGPLSRRRRTEHNPPFWYSFDYASVHFVLLSSEHDLGPGGSQAAWLQADLAAVDRCATPWVVVGIHRPMYVVYPHKDNRIVGEHIRAAIEDLLLQYRVDLVLSGHVHAYYRSCSAAGNKCVEEEQDLAAAAAPAAGAAASGGRVASRPSEGIRHIVMGTAGHVLSNVEDDQKDWCEEVLNEFGFGRFDVDGDVMSFSFIRTEDGSVGDRLTLRSKVAPGDACSSRAAWTLGAGQAHGQEEEEEQAEEEEEEEEEQAEEEEEQAEDEDEDEEAEEGEDSKLLLQSASVAAVLLA
ncbi:hypothetical protein HYH02_004006 [Chlamydomonas schloesseri]|uniref:Purple acid phosphatase n=1 Tax=Chlamydomonas schloesseri TaxID=2026947 RepID=A0A835WPV0_9CHLO|nr:hypothetical protein HYH02_004006 [Chlamydomonas schloesseri]|eukprot:KAG2451406.1 hypothetical protein HYH02_004006 [Chlamydomonas schloesseri]